MKEYYVQLFIHRSGKPQLIVVFFATHAKSFNGDATKTNCYCTSSKRKSLLPETYKNVICINFI